MLHALGSDCPYYVVRKFDHRMSNLVSHGDTTSRDKMVDQLTNSAVATDTLSNESDMWTHQLVSIRGRDSVSGKPHGADIVDIVPHKANLVQRNESFRGEGR